MRSTIEKGSHFSNAVVPLYEVLQEPVEEKTIVPK